MSGAQSYFEALRYACVRTIRRASAGLFVAPVSAGTPRGALSQVIVEQGLACVGGGQYPAIVAETTATGFGSPTMLADNRRRAVFFRPYTKRASFQWAGLGGEGIGPAGANVPVFQPCHVPAHPIWKWEVGFNLNVGGRNMRPVSPLAHTGQNFSFIQSITRDALRAAATADAYQSAIDVTGAALVAVSALVRGEVRHG